MTGGLGFIGSAVIRRLLESPDTEILNIDKETYAASQQAKIEFDRLGRYTLVNGDICERNVLKNIFDSWKPSKVIHLAAESHVDRSITGPSEFINTNILGTFSLLEEVRSFLQSGGPGAGGEEFVFHHVSTDEVFGDLGGTDALFTEDTSYNPSSPYSASKAASDHLVRAWARTYDLPFVMTNCSNNYGPYQADEKFIPKVIRCFLEAKPIPIYGAGDQVRDWLFVEDHARALEQVLKFGAHGETYNIGGFNELKNIEVVHAIHGALSRYPDKSRCDVSERSLDLVRHIDDRPGHDQRYAIDATKIYKQLGWYPEETFSTGIEKTVRWYLENYFK